ncbi:hypothetical protein [Ideonella sp. BN130291]|uniref:hypothetical protein n=1 Tax=Ideonella sp. BN130291 TaxID=3112940 RepID=UPI002E253788|nr:hypothetical protein [Ideonella sp. BN130291]
MTIVVPLFPPGADSQRLLRDWMPGAWIGAVRRAFGPQTELHSTDQGELVEHHPPHWLIALWPPQSLQQPFLRRWPQQVLLLGAEEEAQAVVELLRHVPDGHRLWVLNEELDWALMAEIVLLSEAHLQPFQQQALQWFMDTERAASTDRILHSYVAPPEEVRPPARSLPRAR